MNIFITGISGFIGLNLARKLASGGHTLHALIRKPQPELLSEFRNHEIYFGDLDDKVAINKAMQGCDQAFHLAGLAKPWAKDPNDFHRINVEGTTNILEAALANKVGKVVFTSSAATMSPSDGAEPADEATPRSIPFFNQYESTKAEAEERCREYCRKGLHVVIVNPTRVFGPGPLNPSNSVSKMIIGYSKGKWRFIPGDGKKVGNYVYIDDVVTGHILAAEHGRAGERYILGGDNLTFDEFFQALAEVRGKKRAMIHLPLSVMKAAAQLMEWQTGLTGIPPLISVSFVKKYLNHWSLSSAKAEKELGYRITPFREGVVRLIGDGVTG
jgi:farnesol dehydrogenase